MVLAERFLWVSIGVECKVLGWKYLSRWRGKSLLATWMSQEVSKWLVNGLQPTYKWSILGLQPIY